MQIPVLFWWFNDFGHLKRWNGGVMKHYIPSVISALPSCAAGPDSVACSDHHGEAAENSQPGGHQNGPGHPSRRKF